MTRFLEALLLPPPGLIVLGLTGLLLLATRHRRIGKALLGASVALLYLLATPLVGRGFVASLDRYPPLDPAGHGCSSRRALPRCTW